MLVWEPLMVSRVQSRREGWSSCRSWSHSNLGVGAASGAAGLAMLVLGDKLDSCWSKSRSWSGCYTGLKGNAGLGANLDSVPALGGKAGAGRSWSQPNLESVAVLSRSVRRQCWSGTQDSVPTNLGGEGWSLCRL
ncbi:hypothetical protein NPIL_421981 [Nephila pilipes]|uniref:Uncharacterized protein n=1 Tax=Nephila pilipes TaxID=299642 RepID=A0A8X6KEP4_NEPPI|nr:hypothetical protein NPIL_421981 [Nephila pilipes]